MYVYVYMCVYFRLRRSKVLKVVEERMYIHVYIYRSIDSYTHAYMHTYIYLISPGAARVLQTSCCSPAYIHTYTYIHIYIFVFCFAVNNSFPIHVHRYVHFS
jgi:hypothetical protein